MPLHRSVLLAMLEAASAAGAAIMHYYPLPVQVDYKADHSPLTQADLAAHSRIVNRLQAFPWPLVSEESPTLPDPRQLRSYFLVDPLDGTRDFIKKNGEFTVNIALFLDQELYAGVVLAPAGDRIYLGIKQHGAWKSSLLHPDWQALQVRHKALGDVLSVGISRHASGNEDALLSKLEENNTIMRHPRGSSLKIVEIAEGLLDFYPRNDVLMAWDTAAAQIVLEEAGGQMLTLRGQRLRYGQQAHWHSEAFWALGNHPGIDKAWLGI